jgi:hypothetical protein
MVLVMNQQYTFNINLHKEIKRRFMFHQARKVSNKDDGKEEVEISLRSDRTEMKRREKGKSDEDEREKRDWV